MRSEKRLEYELEKDGWTWARPAARDLRIDHKAKIRERFFVSPPKRSTKNTQARRSPGGGEPRALFVCHRFLRILNRV